MAIAVGKLEYTVKSSPVRARGLSHTSKQLQGALLNPVSSIVFDVEGIAKVHGLLSGIAETEFETNNLRRVLRRRRSKPEKWRVGEAYAEAYLCEHRACYFPWPDGRDERKLGSSLPGADLVGFHFDSNKPKFAFGEVKTSSDNNYPPQSTYGRTGFKKQLRDLKTNESIRDGLVLYLSHRVGNSGWKSHFKLASKRYLGDSQDVALFGVLVRDVKPHERDLSARAKDLSRKCASSMSIELLGIYLPKGSIDRMPDAVTAVRKEGDE